MSGSSRSGGSGAEAMQLWRWCREEGGTYELYSKGEVQDMLMSGAVLPQDLLNLMEKRQVLLRREDHDTGTYDRETT